LLLLTIQLTLQGFFRQKAVLSNKSPPPQPTIPNDRKVILLMVDALREDFVHFDDNEWTRVGEMASKYRGKKLTLFKELRDKQPQNTLLLPMESSQPTVTSVRIKSVLNGGLSTFFETTDEFVSTEVVEDNILYQVKNRKDGFNDKIVFYGDYIWEPMYG
jgi:hypothetical protein